ncbi:MAG: alpha/beta hydrolase [Planctomycetaceae bacterium]|nr:alpha/beta hydrolase [Planctomycetaceae bacterium]
MRADAEKMASHSHEGDVVKNSRRQTIGGSDADRSEMLPRPCGPSRRGLYQAAIRCSLLLTALICAVSARGDETSQVWLLSTRCVNGCDDAQTAAAQICYWQLNDDCEYHASDAAEFRRSDSPAVPTVVFIHGNNTDTDQAVTKGMYVRESIRSQACGKAFRFVIWSWPAERQHLLRNRGNTRQRATQCDAESYYLAGWLSSFRPGVKICLMGHSFGPRIIAGALHLLAGGELACRTLQEKTVAQWSGGRRNPVRAVFMASAMDADSLSPGARNELALSLPEQVLITCNSCDRVLRWYPRLWRHHSPQAMGLIGPYGIDTAENVEVVDVTAEVGRFHDWRGYTSASDVYCRLTHYAFLDETSNPTNEPSEPTDDSSF